MRMFGIREASHPQMKTKMKATPPGGNCNKIDSSGVYPKVETMSGPKPLPAPFCCVCRSHHDEDEPDFNIQDRLEQLSFFDSVTSHTPLRPPNALDGHDALFGRQEPRSDSRVWNAKIAETEKDTQGPGEEVDILPRGQASVFNLAETVVNRAAEDGKKASRAGPPTLSKRLFVLCIESCDDTAEAGRYRALNEAKEKALSVEATEGSHSSGRHSNSTPTDNDW